MRILVPVLLALVASCSAASDSAVQQDVTGGTCMQDVTPFHLNCTANDISIANATNIRDLSGNPISTCVEGSTFSFRADFHVLRSGNGIDYDVGTYFGIGGQGNALAGACGVNVLTPFDPVTGLGSHDFVQLDPSPDVCGDIDSAHNPQIVTVQIDNVVCKAGAGGKLSLPNCTSWRQSGSNQTCTGAKDAFPGTASKCNCDAGATVDILVEHGSLVVTKTATPTSLLEPGGTFTFPVSATNTATFTPVTLDRVCDDRYGTVAGVGCPAGTLGAVNSTDCTVPQTLAPGASYACSFSGDFTSQDPATDTDTVTFSGVDANGGPVSASASATVAITDVPPSAVATKAFASGLCATVAINASVFNPNPSDALTLLALNDSHFGDLMTAHDDVLATTCATTSIPVGGSSNCTFDAKFCGLSETDTFTATLTDGEGNTFTIQSNPLTINVGFTVGP